MANENVIDKASKLGSIRIADEVVSIIAGLAAVEIDGIAVKAKDFTVVKTEGNANDKK